MSEFPIEPAEVPAADWQASALCAQTDPEAFFPEQGHSATPAKRVCMACTVRVECLSYALDHEPHGVWGGKSARERLRINRQREARRAAA